MQELYYNGKLILGVDHGYGNMKTAHRIFAASVEKEVQLGATALEYKGKEYGIGGGGCLIKNFAEYDADRVVIIQDICATAKGYELLALQTLKRTQSRGKAS